MRRTHMTILVGSLFFFGFFYWGSEGFAQGPPTPPSETQHTAIQDQMTTDHGNIRGDISTESTAIQNQMTGEHGDLTTEHGMLETDHDDLADAIAEVLSAIAALEPGEAPPPCGAGTENDRFVLQGGGTEVCDNTTGLFWQQTPTNGLFTWQAAKDHCTNLGQGYALPEIQQLVGLVDYSDPLGAPNALNAPNGPFQDVQGANYVSATEEVVFNHPNNVWNVLFSDGQVFDISKGNQFFRVWCAR